MLLYNSIYFVIIRINLRYFLSLKKFKKMYLCCIKVQVRLIYTFFLDISEAKVLEICFTKSWNAS